MARPALILTEKDILEIDLTLVRLIKESEAKCALLVDQDGRMLARKGYTRDLDCESLAALLAGSFASTKAIATLVGEPEFSIMFHQGEHDNIQNNLVDEDTILSVIFDNRTTIGMVRVFAKEAAARIARTLANARQTNQPGDDDLGDFSGDAETALDALFGPGEGGGGFDFGEEEEEESWAEASGEEISTNPDLRVAEGVVRRPRHEADTEQGIESSEDSSENMTPEIAGEESTIDKTAILTKEELLRASERGEPLEDASESATLVDFPTQEKDAEDTHPDLGRRPTDADSEEEENKHPEPQSEETPRNSGG